jgi:protein TonB
MRMLLEPKHHHFARWIGACALIVALHVVTLVVAMGAVDDDQADETAGAIAVDIATETTALAIESLEAPPGPRQDESSPSQQAVEPLPEKVEEETKEDLPTANPNPEIVLQKSTPVEQAEQPKEVTPEQDVKSTDQSAAAQTTAPPSLDATLSQKAATRQVGTSPEAAKSILSWHKAIALHLNKKKQYPKAARQRGTEGEAYVKFVMDRSGQLISAEITKSSGSALLDGETLALLQRAAPLPRPPSSAQGESFELSVPVRFRISD